MYFSASPGEGHLGPTTPSVEPETRMLGCLLSWTLRRKDRDREGGSRQGGCMNTGNSQSPAEQPVKLVHGAGGLRAQLPDFPVMGTTCGISKEPLAAAYGSGAGAWGRPVRHLPWAQNLRVC